MKGDMILSEQQQVLVEEAFARFLDVYHEERRASVWADREEFEAAQYDAMQEGVAAVLFPKPDDKPASTEAELAEYGAQIDEMVRRRPVPRKLGHVTHPWPHYGVKLP